MSATTPTRDILSNLAPELLIKIFSDVPLPTLLSLVQTSRSLRYFVKENGASICNAAIEARFADENKILGPIRLSGPQSWICPSDSKILEEEARCRTAVKAILTSETASIMEWLQRNNFAFGLGYKWPDVCRLKRIEAFNRFRDMVTANPGISKFTGLTTPGPQYLFFLEEHREYNSARVRLDHLWRIEAAESSTELTGKAKEDYLEAEEKACRQWDFRGGLDLIHKRILRYLNLPSYRAVEYNGNDKAQESEIEFRRAMVWYFGVDKLMGA